MTSALIRKAFKYLAAVKFMVADDSFSTILIFTKSFMIGN